MDAGETRSERQPLLIVEHEVSPGSGVFRVDARLAVEELTLVTDDQLSSAKVAVRLDDTFDVRAARDRYLPEGRIVIRTDEPAPSARTLLFEGYPPLLEVEWDGRPGRRRERCTFTAEHVYGRLARDARCWIGGRRMRNGAIADGLAQNPSAWQGASVLLTGLPCVFNPDGSGNCAPEPLTVRAPDGTPRTIYVFTYDGAPSARRWTYLNVLRYLVWFYRLPEGPIGEGNIFAATDAYVSVEPDSPAAHASSSRLVRHLLVTPDTLDLEATNLVDALATLAAKCAMHITAETVNDAGRAASRLRVWCDRDGPAKTLPLGWGGRHPDGTPRFAAGQMAAAEVYAANVVTRATLAWDARRIVNAPVLVGGVKRYEMTLPLVPGWVPEAELDNVAPANRPAAKALAWTPDAIAAYGEGIEEIAWYRRYHRRGAEFEAYRNVARWWVLNEDGRFDESTYSRNVPFDDYRPFDFSTVATPEVTTAGAWARRPRQLLDPITTATDGTRFGVFAQVSCDAGLTWFTPKGPVRVCFNPTGLYFEVTNPTEITPPDVLQEEQNLWYALIDQTFRVRVTALIESDDRLIVRHRPDGSRTPTLWTTARWVSQPTRYRFQTRRGTTDVLAGLNPDGPGVELDDSAAASRAVERIAEDEQDERIAAAPTLPWLDTAFAIGDRLTGISGRGVSLQSRVNPDAPGPVVLGKRYRLAAGRCETELVVGYTERPENG